MPYSYSTCAREAELGPPDYALAHRRILLEHRCLECQYEGNPEQLCRLTPYEQLSLQLVPGEPWSSKLYTSVHLDKMPKGGLKLPAWKKRLLSGWIAAGAPEFAPRAAAAMPRAEESAAPDSKTVRR